MRMRWSSDGLLGVLHTHAINLTRHTTTAVIGYAVHSRTLPKKEKITSLSTGWCVRDRNQDCDPRRDFFFLLPLAYFIVWTRNYGLFFFGNVLQLRRIYMCLCMAWRTKWRYFNNMVYVRVLINMKLPQIYTFTCKILLNFTKFGTFRIMFQAIQISLYNASKGEDQNNKNQQDALFYSQFISVINLYNRRINIRTSETI